MMILEVQGGHDSDHQHLGVADLGQHMALVPQYAQHIVNHHVGGYNYILVHAAPRLNGLFSSYHFDLGSMNVN